MARQYDYRISSEIWCLEGARGFGSWAGEIWGCTPKSVKSVLDFGSRSGSGRVMSGSRSSRGRVEVESGSLEGLCSDFVNEHTPVRFLVTRWECILNHAVLRGKVVLGFDQLPVRWSPEPSYQGLAIDHSLSAGPIPVVIRSLQSRVVHKALIVQETHYLFN